MISFSSTVGVFFSVYRLFKENVNGKKIHNAKINSILIKLIIFHLRLVPSMFDDLNTIFVHCLFSFQNKFINNHNIFFLLQQFIAVTF